MVFQRSTLPNSNAFRTVQQDLCSEETSVAVQVSFLRHFTGCPSKHALNTRPLLFFKCLSSDSNAAPTYLSSLLNPYIPSRSLRSQNAQLLSLPRFSLKSCGYRSFTVSGPTIWNSLPISLRKIQSLCTFKKHLKTHLFTKFLT